MSFKRKCGDDDGSSSEEPLESFRERRRAIREKEKADRSQLEQEEKEMGLSCQPSEAILAQRRKKLVADRSQLEREEKEMGLNCQPNDVLQLNVGGDTMSVFRRTITSVEGSMLASRFSGRWDDRLERDHLGKFFIDQPIELFRPMIDYLRARACETPDIRPARSPDKNDLRSDRQYDDFIHMVEYYGMTAAIFPTQVKLLEGNMDVDIVGHKVVARKRSTFSLEPQGHSRLIRRFEVMLDEVECFEIGWKSKPNSICLDLARSEIRHSWSDRLPVNPVVTMRPGTVVRCTKSDKANKWFVNGTEVRADITLLFETPFFSGKGAWSILNVLLE
jgi:hypothetical protein